MRVLVAEDFEVMARSIGTGLRREGMAVDVVLDGDEALERLAVTRYDVVVLDRDLPGTHGDEVCRQIVAGGAGSRVLMLTAAGTVADRVDGLGLGADDYLPKPFSIVEVVARIRALLRRGSDEHTTVMQVADLSLNVVMREATRAGHKVDLTNREFALLEYLMAHADRAINKTTLCEHVWEHHFDTGTNVVEVCMQRLRRKIDEGHSRKLLQTIRGTGYSLRGGK
jgi:DNA-binding response OmpR family regulator